MPNLGTKKSFTCQEHSGNLANDCGHSIEMFHLTGILCHHPCDLEMPRQLLFDLFIQISYP